MSSLGGDGGHVPEPKSHIPQKLWDGITILTVGAIVLFFAWAGLTGMYVALETDWRATVITLVAVTWASIVLLRIFKWLADKTC